VIITWLLAAISWMIGLFPAWDPVPSFATTVASWYALPVIGDGLEVMAYLDHFVPISEALSIVGLMVTFMGLWLLWYIVNWIWKALPFS